MLIPCGTPYSRTRPFIVISSALILDEEIAAKLAAKAIRELENDDDADEAENSLVIEEPPLHIDESCADEDMTAMVSSVSFHSI